MSTQIPEEQQTQQTKRDNTRIRYVEELAGKEDAWVSITDAARITRTSEAMARRWVTSGRLPVKRQAVGINQHTRLVRLSDVATIRPIIDLTAAISDEVHTLDLPSIPRQQQKIMQDHEQLLRHIQEKDTLVEELSAHVRVQAQGLEQTQRDLAFQEKKLQDDLERHHMTLAKQLETIETTMYVTIQQQEESFAQHHRDWQQQSERWHHDVVTMQQQQHEQVQRALEHREEVMKRQQDELQQHLAEQQKTSTEQLYVLRQVVETQVGQIKATLEQSFQEQERDIAVQTEWLENIDKRLRLATEQIREIEAFMKEYQRQKVFHDQQMQRLLMMIQDETRARKKEGEHFSALRGQLQALQRELSALKHQKRNSNSVTS